MKIIIHFGAGKTGSTSIQKSLKVNEEKLRDQGIYYLGMMLENAPEVKYEWQKPTSVVEDFHRMSEEEAKTQILDVLRPAIEYAKQNDLHTLVWSNESFFGRQYSFKGAVSELQSEGIEVVMLAYVRKYDSWAASAYTQWGIKHKTYRGRLQNFRQWIENHQPNFYAMIEPLLSQFPEDVKIRNMNAVGDVTVDFMQYIGADISELTLSRENDSPEYEELFLRALFNDQYEEPVLPNRFNHIFNRLNDFSKTPETFLETLLPNNDDMKWIYESSEEDRKKLNDLLVRQDQKPFGEEPNGAKKISLNDSQIIMAMASMIMQQSRRIDRLERLLKKK